jgi:hypothetical protein
MTPIAFIFLGAYECRRINRQVQRAPLARRVCRSIVCALRGEAAVSSVSPARHVQCNHSSDDGNYADDLEDADRLSKVENPDSRYQRGADTAPDGIGDADIDLLESQSQEIKADTVEKPHQHGRRGLSETSREFHAGRACYFGENSECEVKPVHIIT